MSYFMEGNMLKNNFKISNIPAVLWGEKSEKVFIAVHGNMSNKEDAVIQILAEEANRKGYQVLSLSMEKEKMITLLAKYSFVLVNYL
ncbi:Alpha/beta hydrolase [Bacillus thuringiensis IBL 200]|nr:Alpha/beta hydrolase [Bacillus thuringiensis IBL 200]